MALAASTTTHLGHGGTTTQPLPFLGRGAVWLCFVHEDEAKTCAWTYATNDARHLRDSDQTMALQRVIIIAQRRLADNEWRRCVAMAFTPLQE